MDITLWLDWASVKVRERYTKGCNMLSSAGDIITTTPTDFCKLHVSWTRRQTHCTVQAPLHQLT